MSQTRKIQSVIKRESHDAVTGEVTETNKTVTYKIPKEPPFVKMYITDLGRLHNMSGGQNDVLYALVKRVGYDGFVNLTPHARKLICEEIGIKNQSLSNAILALCKKGLMRNVGRGCYELNPNLFARGEWPEILERRENFKLTVDYGKDGSRSVRGCSDLIGK